MKTITRDRNCIRCGADEWYSYQSENGPAYYCTPCKREKQKVWNDEIKHEIKHEIKEGQKNFEQNKKDFLQWAVTNPTK